MTAATHRSTVRRDASAGSRSSHAWILGVALVLYPFNVEWVSILRPVDIWLGLAFLSLLINNQLRADLLGPFAAVIALLAISALWGLLVVPGARFSIAGLAFFLKYVQLLTILWTVLSLRVSSNAERNLLMLSGVVFWLLVVYIYLDAGFRITYQVNPVSIRPDFPLTDPGEGFVKAGHLMGAYLGTGLVMWAVYRLQTRGSFLVSAVTTAVLLGAVFMTGSRTPVAAIAGTAVFALAIRIRGSFTWKRKRFALALLAFVAIAGTVTVLLLAPPGDSTSEFRQLMARATDFNLGTDLSTQRRLSKSIVGLDNLADSGWLLGAGVFAYPEWFDSGLLRVAHDLGLLGFFAVGFLLFRFVKRGLRSGSPHGISLAIGSFCYFLSNVPTEFFLVTRASVPFIVTAFLFYRLARTGASPAVMAGVPTRRGAFG